MTDYKERERSNQERLNQEQAVRERGVAIFRSASVYTEAERVNPGLNIVPYASKWADEVAAMWNDSRESCWKAIDGKVYDVTAYIPAHPTPERVILRWCGRDSTAAWNDKGDGRPHSPVAAAMLRQYLIGKLGGYEAATVQTGDASPRIREPSPATPERSAAMDEVQRRDVVEAGGHAGADPGDERPGLREIGAHIGEDLGPHGQNAPLGVERELGLGDIVTALAIGEEMLGPVGHPFHRAPERPGGMGGQRIFEIAEDLGAEAAAHVRRDHADAGGAHLEHHSERRPHAVHALRAEGDGIAVGLGIVFGHDGARLQEVGHHPLIDHLEPRHPGCGAEGGICRLAVAALVFEGEVGAMLGPDQRRFGLKRASGVDHDG
jgi:cytochrome b involved in lipid metabolism